MDQELKEFVMNIKKYASPEDELRAKKAAEVWVKYALTAGVGMALLYEQLSALPGKRDDWFMDRLSDYRRNVVEPLTTEQCFKLFVENPDLSVLKRPEYISADAWGLCVSDTELYIKKMLWLANKISKAKLEMFMEIEKDKGNVH